MVFGYNEKGSVMSEFERLKDIVARLRAEDGCPWDRVQTHETLKPEVIEEAAEVIEGINVLSETGNPAGLQEELGDLLLQVVMHAQIAEEEGFFTLEDVCRGIADKMVRRHPHVFTEYQAENEAQIHANWAEIKRQEKAGKEWMDGYLPAALEESKELIEAAKRRKGFV